MLPPSFDYQKYEAIILTPDTLWDRYRTSGARWDGAVDDVASKPMILEEIRKLNLPKSETPAMVRKALMLLEKALGPQILTALFRFHREETVAAMFPFVKYDQDNHPPAYLRSHDLQLDCLTRAIQQLVMELGGRKSHEYLVSILDSIFLPYSKHQIIFTQVSEALKARPTTFQ